MKKLIILSMTLLLSVGLITGCGKKKKEEKPDNGEGPKVNENKDVIKDQQVEVFKFESTNLIYDNGNSKFETIVTNTSSEVAEIVEFRIHVMKDNIELVNLPGFIGGPMQPGETRVLPSKYGADLTMATSIRYEIVR